MHAIYNVYVIYVPSAGGAGGGDTGSTENPCLSGGATGGKGVPEHQT